MKKLLEEEIEVVVELWLSLDVLSFKPAWRPGQQQNSLILALIILTSLKMSSYFLSNHLRKDYDNEGKDHDKNDENIKSEDTKD